MQQHKDRRSAALLAAAACIFFFCAGQAFLPLLGVQNDEALFATPWFAPPGGFFLEVAHARLPIMLMSYLGTLKSWIYLPLFQVFGTGIWTLREPPLLAGAASIWLFFLLLRRIAGSRAALIGCFLLATDATYLLTVCFDWGPVALQHLLLIGGMFLLLRFYQQGDNRSLAGGFLLFGLAMWDKALAVWMLSGMGVAALAVFPRQILRVTGVRRLALAAAAFCLGALPLIVFNAQTGLATFGGKRYTLDELPSKARVLADTARGEALYGWMVAEDRETPVPHEPQCLLEQASAALSRIAGHPRENLLAYAFLLALLLTPLARGAELRGILFAVLAMAVQWAQMAVTVEAGTSAHHTVLLWPLPQLTVALSFSAAARRMGRAGAPALAAALAAVLAAGLLQVNEYYRLAWRNGGPQNWTDAIYALADYMKRSPANQAYCADWGIYDGLRLLDRGALPLQAIYDAFPQGQGAPDMERVRAAVSRPEHVFIGHAAGMEFFRGRSAQLAAAAAALGYRRSPVAAVRDSYGRPAFEVYRFIRQPSATPARERGA